MDTMNQYAIKAFDAEGNELYSAEFECLAVNLDTQNGWITYVPEDESAVGIRILDTWASFLIDQLATAEPAAATATAAATA